MLEIRSQCEITDAQARALRLALELRTYSEIAAALGVTKKAIEALSTRIEQRTGKTLAQWTRLAREELHEPRPIDGPDSGVRPQLPERERTRRRRM